MTDAQLNLLKDILLGDPDMPEAIRPLAYLQSMIDDMRKRGPRDGESSDSYYEAADEVQELHDKLKEFVK